MAHRPALDDGFGYWLAGFIDGEGCFTIREHRQQESPYYSCRFSIQVRDDDTAILYEISERTGIGSLSRTVLKSGNPKASWVVQRKDDCRVLVDILDSFPLRAKKHRDYVVWREAVIEWSRYGRGGAPGFYGQATRDWTLMREAREALMEVRAYA